MVWYASTERKGRDMEKKMFTVPVFGGEQIAVKVPPHAEGSEAVGFYEKFTIGESYGVISKAVGGYIECVSLPSVGIDMWVDEEGKLAEVGYVNAFGTILMQEEYGTDLNGPLVDIVVGTVIFTGGTDEEGETLGLSPEQVEFLEAKLHEVEEYFVSY
jgi:hypothetical protein